jgi:hypothetical protein
MGMEADWNGGNIGIEKVRNSAVGRRAIEGLEPHPLLKVAVRVVIELVS